MERFRKQPAPRNIVAKLLVANEALVSQSALEKSCKFSGIIVDERGFEPPASSLRTVGELS